MTSWRVVPSPSRFVQPDTASPGTPPSSLRVKLTLKCIRQSRRENSTCVLFIKVFLFIRILSDSVTSPEQDLRSIRRKPEITPLTSQAPCAPCRAGSNRRARHRGATSRPTVSLQGSASTRCLDVLLGVDFDLVYIGAHGRFDSMLPG